MESDELALTLFLTDLLQHLKQRGLALDGLWELLAALEEALLLETLLSGPAHGHGQRRGSAQAVAVAATHKYFQAG